MIDIQQHKILILDFGSQYTQLIARCVRKLGVYCEIYPYYSTNTKITQFNPKGIILSGGPDTVHVNHAAQAPAIIFKLDIPILGICYGMQTMAAQLGGKTIVSKRHEYGFARICVQEESALLADIYDEINTQNSRFLDVWMSHSVEVSVLPKNFICIASSDNCAIAGFAESSKHYYGLQFHPEVTHTKQGMHILENFVVNICACETNWRPKHIINTLICDLRAKISTEKVLLALSGGVDSSVVAALIHLAVDTQLTCVFIDNGLLRKNEGDEVINTLRHHLDVEILCINAEKTFLKKLAGVFDPEEKRNVIGHSFIKVFNQKAKQLGHIKFLAQGTIYPDVIESAGLGKNAKTIKSHHNVGGLPKKMKFILIEPLKELFKDEVRAIGTELGLPKKILYRHPFPGPGLGVRVLGEVKPKYVDILRQADFIFISELHAHNLYDKVSQAFAVFLPIKSVGVTGDARRYEYVIALRAVKTIDFMTATWAKLPHDFLALVANRIVAEIPKISRVVYDISGKPPATIEWE